MLIPMLVALEYLRRLAPHYPNLRRIISMLYTVRKNDSKLCVIDRALQTGNVDGLQNIVKEHKEHQRHYGVPCDQLDESQIKNIIQ